jgi:UDP-glucose 4-epimerase
VRHALVTGATGFIGRHLVKELQRRHVRVTVLTRTPGRAASIWPRDTVTVLQGDLGREDIAANFSVGYDTVFHLAGYAHAEDADSVAAKAVHRAVTVDGTRAVIHAALEAETRCLIFASSVKAMGEGTDGCLDETTAEMPTSCYGCAKREAEKLVLAAGGAKNMRTTVIRLPLVYGPGNRGNIPRMISAIDRRRFPSIQKVKNMRSMIHVEDVVQALLIAAENPEASGQVYIVTDGGAYSTGEIYRAICQGLGRKIPGWSVPSWILSVSGKVGDLLGRVAGVRMPLNSVAVSKLLGSAWYSPEKIRRELGFRPTHTLYDALPQMIAEHRASVRSAVASSS